MKLILIVFGVLVLTVSLGGCKKYIPEGKDLYIGDWHTNQPEIVLEIGADGKAYYYGGPDTEVGGPIRFESNGFKIKNGSNPLGKIEFEVTQEPSPDSAGYFMIANGMTFHRN